MLPEELCAILLPVQYLQCYQRVCEKHLQVNVFNVRGQLSYLCSGQTPSLARRKVFILCFSKCWPERTCHCAFLKNMFFKKLLALMKLIWYISESVMAIFSLICWTGLSELEELAWCFLGMRKVYEEMLSARTFVSLLCSPSIEKM